MKMGEKNYLKLVQQLNELYKGSLKLDMRALAKGETDLDEALKKLDTLKTISWLNTMKWWNQMLRSEKLKQSRSCLFLHRRNGSADGWTGQSGEELFLQHRFGPRTIRYAWKVFTTVWPRLFFMSGIRRTMKKSFWSSHRGILKSNRGASWKRLITNFDRRLQSGIYGITREILSQIDRKISELQANSGELLRSWYQLEESRADASDSFNTLSLHENLNTIQKIHGFQ